MDHFKFSASNICPNQSLWNRSGKSLEITFTPDATPSVVHPPNPVSQQWGKKVKQDPNRDVVLGIIEPVPVATPEKKGSPRRTIDFQKLNATTMRETHHAPSPFSSVSIVQGHTRKRILDAWKEYHRLPLSPMVQDATTFITGWDR